MEGFSNICKCFCSSLFQTSTNGALPSDRGFGDKFAFEEEPPFLPPLIDERISYQLASNQPLRGQPIREASMWRITSEDKCEEIQFSLYINGFSFKRKIPDLAVPGSIPSTIPLSSDDESVSLNPFALVRNCKFQTQHNSLQQFKIFKVSLFPQGSCFYFGLLDDEDRARWVLDISHAIRLITQSLFPKFRMRCDPIKSVPLTHRRIMAGYLLHLDPHKPDDGTIAGTMGEVQTELTLVYCELHAHMNDHGKLVLYKNEMCSSAMLEIPVTQKSICCEKVGINCSCFCFEDHNFSSRTLSERKLWLRAFSNVKVKVQNRAPTPNEEQLSEYRAAIREHVCSMMEGLEETLRIDPLLTRSETTDA